MTIERYPEITDELLSAYLDDEVDAGERRLLEQAIATDPGVAWRLESLRATVQLLHELPALALPRSFVLSPAQAGQHAAEPVAIAPSPAPLRQPTATPPRPRSIAEPGFWARWGAAWQDFWRAGNPALRNAMAASFAAFLVLLVAPALLGPRPGLLQQEQVVLQDQALFSESDARKIAPAAAAYPAPEEAQGAQPDLAQAEPNQADIATSSQQDTGAQPTGAAPAIVLAEAPDRRGAAYATSSQPPAVAAPALNMPPAERESARTAPSAGAPAAAPAGPAPDALSAAAAPAPPPAGDMAVAAALAPAEVDVAAAQTSGGEPAAKAMPVTGNGMESGALLIEEGSGQPGVEPAQARVAVSLMETTTAAEDQTSQPVAAALPLPTISSLAEVAATPAVPTVVAPTAVARPSPTQASAIVLGMESADDRQRLLVRPMPT
jgi:anti-sigma factor RsiW